MLIVTRDGLAQLARYIAGTRAWIVAAADCLESP